MFKIREMVLMFTKANNRNRTGDEWRICLLESLVSEVWSQCPQSDAGGHRGVEVTLSKFLRGFFVLSTHQKIRFLNSRCDTCL